jgi:hypothetical protein
MFSPGLYNSKERKLGYKKIIQSFCIIVVALLFSSCEQNVDIEIRTNDKRLLVDGEFTNDTVVHSIRLYCSGDLVTGKPPITVSGARIFITDNIQTFYYIESKDTPGLYQTGGNVGGIGGHNYTVSITNIDIDNDGKMDSYTANSMMPVPLKFDSLVSFRGLNGGGRMGVGNIAYYKLFYNGPDFAYYSLLINSDGFYTLPDRLGTGELTRFVDDFRVPKVLNSRSFIYHTSEISVNSTINKGDTISCIFYNFTTAQFEFLREFDSNTTTGDPGLDYIVNSAFDQLKIPTNLPTNIEPSEKAAGYFFIYSVSKISNVFNQ